MKKLNPFIGALILLSLVLSFVNYQPGTWLSGWDTLHPEFNFALYFKRILFGVWQEHQGLGAVASQSHAGEIPRMLLIYPFSLFLPESFLRYGYFFLTLIVGAVGAYFFLEKVIFKARPKAKKQTLAFSGALFYLLNLSTLQHYYVPLEMFATHFATLPWLFLFATRYLEKRKSKDLILFSVFTLFAAPASHTATLFYAYFLALLLYLLSYLLVTRKRLWKRLAIIFSATLLLNSFWLLPNVYFVLNHADEVAASKIHTQFSEKAFLTGRKFGTFLDTGLLKNFLFDWGEYDEVQGGFVDLFDEWEPHLTSPVAGTIGYSLFLLVLLGVVVSARNIYTFSLLPVFLLSFFLIANNNPVSTPVFAFLERNFPVLKEALRFPFTKFSILLSLTYAVYFALALEFLSGLFSGRFRRSVYLQTILVALALVYYMLPAFSGNLISPSMKVAIPQDYFAAFAWFNEKSDDGRIAPFPAHTFWGWVYHDWGYEGAGFRWFGLKQPILDREFDRWSPYNENYYWEISHALYSKNLELFEKVLEKYQVRYLLLDWSATNPSSTKSIYLAELTEMITNSDKVRLAREFGKLAVYEVNLEFVLQNSYFFADNLPVVSTKYKWSNFDPAFFENGHYVNAADSIIYPFNSLFTGRKQEEQEFEIEDKENHFLLRKKLGNGLENYFLDIPHFDKEDLMRIDKRNLLDVEYLTREVAFEDGQVEVKIPKAWGYLGRELDAAAYLEAKSCGPASAGSVSNELVNLDGKKLLRLRAIDAHNCSIFIELPNLPHKSAYLITVESRNISGKGVLFWIENHNARRADLEAYLPEEEKLKTYYFIQPPMEEEGMGYTLHLDNISVGGELTLNDVGRIIINPIPYEFLTGLKLSPFNTQRSENRVLVLSQAYHPGWSAYFVNGISIKSAGEHVLVNNWSNGWLLEKDARGKVHFVFWPQFLQFLGFAFLVVPAFYLLQFRKRS